MHIKCHQRMKKQEYLFKDKYYHFNHFKPMITCIYDHIYRNKCIKHMI